MEYTSTSKKTTVKQQSFIPVPNRKNSGNREGNRFNLDGIENTSTDRVEGLLSPEMSSRSSYGEARTQKNWQNPGFAQMANYKGAGIFQQGENGIIGKDAEGNEDEEDNAFSSLRSEDFASDKAVSSMENLEDKKAELVALFSVKQLELEEIIQLERNKQERYFTQEIIKMQKKFTDEIALLTQKFDEEKVLLEQFNKEQLREITEQQRFEKDEKMTSQISEPKPKPNPTAQEMYFFAIAALFISILSILISLLW